MGKVFDASWQQWLKTNIERGCNKNELTTILLEHGFDINVIEQQFSVVTQAKQTASLNVASDPFTFHPSFAVSQSDPLIRQQNAQQKQVQQRLIRVQQQLTQSKALKLESDALELYTLNHFLSAQECQAVIDLISSKLRPSELASQTSDSNFRTSRTCDLGIINNQLIARIDKRICDLLAIPATYAEVIQGQYYEVGQQFKAHTDYFEAYELQKHGGKMGQRTYTVMIYLNDVEAGGETNFLNVGIGFKPQQGMAVIWNSLNADLTGNINSLHQAEPVKKGFKAVITKWFRQNSV
ncbi:prolyl hydroxylase family protein [Catenovulum sediminis]|uniref:2OG-Fe(II) oxygenase n=1 Tax=Catenovulum sediminis TaxID=1740262 RepID=A0ABV1RH62_9ALTE